MDLILLDVDGTLTQSFEYDRIAFGIAIAEAIGCQPVDVDLDNYFSTTSIGVTLEAFQRICRRLPDEKEILEVKSGVLCQLERMRKETPALFAEVSGASSFLKRLLKVDGVGVAIATGGWLSEAQFKLQASGLTINGIPIATSDDHKDRKRIMEIATDKAREYYNCRWLEHIIYLGDGPWDLQASRSLSYDFIGIGPRVQDLKYSEEIEWFQDFKESEAVLASIKELCRK
jgi:phosphoglycolate phosphatase-like HAD superfamily hydrolase